MSLHGHENGIIFSKDKRACRKRPEAQGCQEDSNNSMFHCETNAKMSDHMTIFKPTYRPRVMWPK